jgi:hypothetical protein
LLDKEYLVAMRQGLGPGYQHTTGYWTPPSLLAHSLNTEHAAKLLARAFGPIITVKLPRPRPRWVNRTAGCLAAVIVGYRILRTLRGR